MVALALCRGTQQLMTLTYHPDRDRLLAEAHARPSTPLDIPVFATRIATLGDQDGGAADRAHLAELCRSSLLPEPSDGARWWAFDAGGWTLRWERHTEFSSWTFFCAPPNAAREKRLAA